MTAEDHKLKTVLRTMTSRYGSNVKRHLFAVQFQIKAEMLTKLLAVIYRKNWSVRRSRVGYV